MWEYLINEKSVTFKNESERAKGISEAEGLGYSIELVSEPEEQQEQTQEEKQGEKDPILASIEANAPKENFTQDPVKSADAASETAAQVGMELPPEDTSSDLPEETYSIEGIDVTKQEYEDYQALVASRKDDEITELLGGTPVNDKPVYGRVLNENGEIDFIEEPYEDQMRNYKNTYLDAITGSGNFAYLQDKSIAERKYLADKLVPKPTLVKKQYNQQTDKYELVPTADATAMVKEALPSNFSSYNTPEQFDKATDVAIAKVMQEDPILQFDINVNIAASKDKMTEVVKKLQEKYDTSDPAQYEKAVKEYNEALNELVLEPVYNSPTYQNTRSQLYKVIDEVAADNKKQFGRSKDSFLSYVDRVAAARGGESSTAMVLTESVYKGIKMMQGDFNRAQVGFAQDNLKEAVGGIGEIEKGLKGGSINLTDKATWGNVNPKTGQRTFSGTVEEKLAWLKKEQKKAMDSIVFDLEEAGEVDKYVSLFNAADLKDGISFDDMTMLLGESLPQMTAAIAGTAATTLTGNPMFAALGFMSMFTTEYGANYIGAIEQGLINDKIEVTDENIIKALEEGKYANQATAVAGAAISAGLEQIGGLKVAKRTLKALNLGENIVKGSASLFRGEIKKIVKQGGRQAFENVKSGLGEALTEVGQTVASQVTLGSQLDGAGKYLNFEEIKESAIAGGALGFVLPFGGNVMAQSRIELRNSARAVATRFDFGKYGNQLKAVNGFFKKAETNLKDKFELNEITEEEYQEELEALNLARTTGFKLPKNLSETSREKAFDLLLEKQKIQNDIEGVAPEMVTSQKDRIKAIDVELGNIAAVDKMNKGGKSLLKSADIDSDTEYVSVGTNEELETIIKKKGYSSSQADGVKTAYGAYAPAAKKGEKPFVIINEQLLFEKAEQGGKLKNNTAAHEILHKVLQDVMTPEQRINLGTNLLQAVQSAYGDVSSFESSVFGKRMAEYQRMADRGDYTQAQLAEEVFTVLGEAMLDGDMSLVKENVGVIQKIKDLISDAYKAITGKPIEFNTEDDLFKFLEDYNKSVVKGKGLSKSIKATIKQGAKGKLAEAKGTGKVESLIAKRPTVPKKTPPTPIALSLDTTKSDAALAALEEAEALRDEDFDNPTLQQNVEKAEAAYDQALIEEQNAEEDAEVAADAPVEATEAAPKEKIQRPKADKSKRRYSLDTEVKKGLEPKIAKAQAANKKLIEQEKELNKKLIADIEAIPDKEVKRTEKDKRIAELKNNPRRVAKPADLNKLEKEIAEALKTPIDKAVNLFTRLYYDRISDNAKTAVTREEFMQSARAEITSITINEFKPETINRQGENIINDIEDIVFQRGGLRLRNLAERLGVVGRDQGVARGAEALTKIAADDVDTSFDSSDADSVTSDEKRKVSALLAGEGRYSQAKEQIQEFWKENEGNTKVENFKKLPNLINNILSEMFGVTESTLAARSGNLNKGDYRNAIEAFTGKQAVFTIKEDGKKKEVRVPISEVGAFQDRLNEQRASNKDFSFKREANESIAEALIRFLPKTSADDYVYASGRKGRFSGKSTGLPKNLMELAYKIESRKTTGIGNVERTAQKLTIEEIYEAIGATVDADGNVVKKPSISGRDREGQTLLGLIKLTGRMVTNELSRTETDLDPMTKKDIAAGKNEMMFSLAEKGINLSNNIVNSLTDQEIILLAGITNERNITAINNNITDLKENSEPGVYARLKPFIDNYKKEWERSQKAEWPDAEQKIIDVFKDLEKSIPGLKITQTELNKDSSKLDYTFKIDGKEVNLEVKKNLKARLGSLGIHFDAKKGYYLDEKYNGIDGKYRQKLIKNETKITQESLTEAIALYPNDIFVTYNTKSRRRKIEVTYDAYFGLKKRGWFKESQIKTDLPVAYVSQYYAGKKGDAINFGDVGLFNVGNKNMFQAPNLEQKGVDVSVKTYWRPYFKNNKRITITRTATPELSTESQKVLASQTNLNLAKSKEAALLLKTNNASTLGNQKLMPKALISKSESNSEFLKNAEAFDKAITLGNSLDQETRGISVWDFDDTLAKTKSSVLYTMPGAPSKVTEKEFNNLFKQKTVYYHGTSAVVDQKFVNKEIVKDFPEGASSFSVQMQGLGKHYTKSLDNAKSFIDHRNRKDNTGTVAAVSISANNPKQFKTYQDLLNDIKSTVKNKDISISERNKEYLSILKSEGFDSITYKEGPSYNPNKKSLMAEAVIPFDSAKKLIGSADYKQRNEGIVKESAVAVKQNKLNAEEFAKYGDELLAQGAEFDFSEFSKVVKGEKGPFFEKAMARNKKFGNENVFILTARPANSALAIHEFLKGIGLDIPLANITGLANSDPQAKANWVVNKFAEGYNDFYFADDHIGNVKAVKDVLSQLDVKSKVQQARISLSTDLSKRFNQIIEEESGIESFKEYQSVKAAKKGAGKGRFKFFVPPTAEDFLGLLYTTLPKGKKGESAMAFYKEHLLDPYGKAISGLRTGRITIGKNYRALKKDLGIVPRKLKKRFKYKDENGNMKESLFTKEDAIRVYTWDAQGFEIPGLSNVDLPVLVNYVNSNPDLKAFADKLLGLNKNVDPKAPTESWPAGTITSDLLNTLNTDGRKQLLEVWQQNVDAIFTPTNLNKLEAAYGKSYVTALKDSLRRMRTGRNSTPTNNNVTDGIVRWLNAAVGNIMFLNRRSAVLQLISFTNFINFEGNNLYQAGKAFANQPQYWKDWTMLMNSDYLVDRRDGLKINVNEADIATTAKENGFQGVLAKILQVGFIPTKMADSAAIATGGASFYRNRVNTYLNEKTINGTGYTLEQAEKQAMQDFVATAEVSQQSSDPSKISKQQAEPIGRIILAFANTPSQYARIIKRAAQDLKNGRGDAKTHLSRIVYYGVLQNVMFNFLQQAMFAAMMGDDEDEETEELTKAKEANIAKKSFKVANSMTDGILRGIGVAGAVVSVAKNLAIKLYERSQKTRNQDLAATIKDEVMKISPPISSKLSKAGKVGNAFEWGKKEIEFDKMSLKHPYVTAATNTVAALTGLPLDRAQGMAIDAADIASDETETWMKPLIALGWPKWQLMSEEDTKKEREENKERFKELEADKKFQELNPTEQRRLVLKKLSKKEQIDILWNSGLSKTEIKKLSKESDRIDKIMGLQDKKQFDKDMEALSKGEDIEEMPKIERPKKEKKQYTPAVEKKRKVLKDLSKKEQVDFLWNNGLSKTQIRALNTEESRIDKIIELQNKKRKNSLK